MPNKYGVNDILWAASNGIQITIEFLHRIIYVHNMQAKRKKEKLTIYLNKFSESIGLEKWRFLKHKTEMFISQLISSVV